MTIYTPNIPQAGDDPSQSQAQILQNFQSLQDAQDKNHVTLQDITNRGLHKFLQMPEQGSDPSTAVDQLGWYAKDIGGNSRFCMRQENNGTVIQMTGADPLLATSGHTFLPGGLLLQWGSFGPQGGTSVGPINFPTAFTTIYTMTATLENTVNATVLSCSLRGVSNTGFSVDMTAGTKNIRYFAIGLA